MALPLHVMENRRRFYRPPPPKVLAPSNCLLLRWPQNGQARHADRLEPGTDPFVQAVAELAAAAETSIDQALSELQTGETMADHTHLYKLVFKHA